MSSYPRIVGLDFETFSGRDIRKVGLDNYLKAPDFKPLIASIAFQEQYSSVVQTKTFNLLPPGPAEGDIVKSLFDALNHAEFISAHNAGFEIGVLRNLGAPLGFEEHMIDSAVISSCMGGSRSLDAASRQFLDTNKMSEGKDLIKLFCVPNATFDFKAPTMEQILASPELVKKWMLFIEYCERDAENSYKLTSLGFENYSKMVRKEQSLGQLTQEMNDAGWQVDMDAVHVMSRLYQENLDLLLEEFQKQHDPDKELNLNSLPQLKAWCKARGIRATSFDEKHVDSMIRRIEKQLAIKPSSPVMEFKHKNYRAVLDMLKTKQALGGSSLKKLDVLLDQTDEHGILRNSYMHCGAGQTFRTTGKGVQMQNLKRLDQHNLMDMSTLTLDPPPSYSNEELANNLRQVFTSRYPDGRLFVGDFSSVESRGLAYLAGEKWKLDAYRQGQDLYKVLASKIYGVRYEDVTDEQRRTGKVGELSCGYGAGAGAVQTFAEKMGTPMTEVEAASLVRDWRAANEGVVELWATLDDLLHMLANPRGPEEAARKLAHGLEVHVVRCTTPKSLRVIHPGAQSLLVELTHPDRKHAILQRFFHGVYEKGHDLCYYKPSEKHSGPPWVNRFRNPKTGELMLYKIYGGKLTGILTQSFCREIFFKITQVLSDAAFERGYTLCGQFHDELVMDVNMPAWPNTSEKDLIDWMHKYMTVKLFEDFPLEAEVHCAYRYIK